MESIDDMPQRESRLGIPHKGIQVHTEASKYLASSDLSAGCGQARSSRGDKEYIAEGWADGQESHASSVVGSVRVIVRTSEESILLDV